MDNNIAFAYVTVTNHFRQTGEGGRQAGRRAGRWAFNGSLSQAAEVR